jgi:hypothetical protein
MDAMSDIADGGIEALLTGHGHDTDPRLAQVLTQLRHVYTAAPPIAGPALAALLAPAPQAACSRPNHLRASILRKLAAAAAVIAATFGGLAAANALPAPFQDAVAHLGIGHADVAQHFGAPSVASTTAPIMTTTTSLPTSHGSVVRAAAHEHTNCTHGSAVAQVASNGRTHNPGRQTQASSERCAQQSKPARSQQPQHPNTQRGHRSDQDAHRPNSLPHGQHEANSESHH